MAATIVRDLSWALIGCCLGLAFVSIALMIGGPDLGEALLFRSGKMGTGAGAIVIASGVIVSVIALTGVATSRRTL